MSSWVRWPCSWSTSCCGASPGCARPGTRSRKTWRCCEAPRKRPSRRQSRPGDPMAGNGGSPIYADGPWSHRTVTANGTRFHIAEAGEGPLVLLLHGFPQFWWTWRAQLESLPAAGYRAVAADLRGYGGSDKPPRGYDLITGVRRGRDGPGAGRGQRRHGRPRLGRAGRLDHGHLLPEGGQAPRRGFRGPSAADASHPAHRRGPQGRQRADVRLPAAAAAGTAAGPARRQVGRPDAARVVRAGLARPGGGAPLPRRHVHPLGRALGPGVSPLVRAVQAAVRRDALRPPHAGTGAGAHPAAARGARQLRAGGHRAGQRPLRRRAVPVAADRRHGAFPAGRAVGPLHRRAVPLAGRPRAGTMTGQARDRDPGGRPRNARPRDAFGRPLPRGAAGEQRIPDDLAVPPEEALSMAQGLLDTGRPFHAHEVLEASWKAAPAAERELWRGLAQIAVGLTHVQRGNATGAAALLRR